ncbi:Ig-like domain-containing protein [Pseudoteredinibacter isoporae]|uniref:Ig-like domain-containing protein n=1 Tax=Pseudoteredinibacter isoporae TaxID=570281 RepID=UPI003104EEE5
MTSIATILDNAGSITGQVQHLSKSDDDSLQLNGTSDPGNTVRIYQNDTLIGETVADQNGQWQYTADQLNEGSHGFSVSSVDGSGVESLRSAEYTVNVDQTALIASDLQIEGVKGTLSSGSSTHNGHVTMSGRAEENSRVEIFDNGQLVGEVQTDANGLWEVKLKLDDGQHQISTVVVDSAGNSSPESIAIELDVDSPPHGVANGQNANSPQDVILPPNTPIQDGGFTNDNTPIIRGTATPNADVTVTVNGETYGPFKANGQGNWELQVTTPLPEGLSVFKARAVNSFGESFSAYSLTIDTEASPAPVINSVLDDVGLFQGNLNDQAHTDDNEITLQGMGTAGEFITVYDGGVFIGATQVQTDGSWTFTNNAPLDDGIHNFTAYTIDAAGNTSSESLSFEITVDQSVEAPIITHLIDDQGNVTGDIPAGGETDDALPVIAGTAEPNADVAITLNGQALATITADEQGNWTLALVDELSGGTQTVVATQTDRAGNQSAPSQTFEFNVNLNSAPIANDDSFTINRTSTLDVLANDNDPDNDNLSVSQIISQGNHGTAHINQSGELVYTPNGNNTQTVSDTLVYEVSDGRGGVSTATVTLQVLPPIEEPTLDLLASSDSGKFNNDNITNDTTPTFTGTASAGSTVVLFADNTQVGQTIADANGQWTITSNGLADNNYQFHVVSSDQGVSRSSAELPVQIDTVVDASVDVASQGNSVWWNTPSSRFNSLSDLRFEIQTNEYVDYDIQQTNTHWCFGWQFFGFNPRPGITATGNTSANASVGPDDASIHAQGRFNFNATLTDLAGNQKSTAINSVIIDPIASLADGGYIVTYLKLAENAEDGFDVYAQRYDAEGQTESDSFRVNSFTLNDQSNSDVIGLADGGYVITWQSRDQDGDLNGIFAQRYDVNNQAVGPETQINVYSDENQQRPAISDLADGGYVITWMSHGQDGSGEGVYMRVFNAAGEAITGDVRVTETAIDHQANPSITTLNDGRFVVSWDSPNTDGAPQSMARLFDSNGDATGPEFSLSETDTPQFQTHISASADGGFVVSWLAVSSEGEAQVTVQRYDANGNSLMNQAITVHSSESAFNSKPEVAGLNNGDFVVTWTAEDGDQLGVFASRYRADGSVIFENKRINPQAQGVQAEPHIVALEDGGYLITWGDQQLQEGRASVWGQQFDAQDNATGPAFEVGQVVELEPASEPDALLDDGESLPTVTDAGQASDSTAASPLIVNNGEGNMLPSSESNTDVAELEGLDVLAELTVTNLINIDLSDVFIDADLSFNRGAFIDTGSQTDHSLSTSTYDAIYEAGSELADLLNQQVLQADLDFI